MSSDSSTFRELVHTYTDYVYNLAYRNLGNADDARDVTQEVFLKLYRNMGKLDAGKSIKNWICTIAINASRDYYRTHRRHRGAFSLDEGLIAARNQGHPDNKLLVEKMLSTLDGKYRTVVVLFYLEQKSIAEIASMLKRPQVLVKVWLHRARKILMKNFAEEIS